MNHFSTLKDTLVSCLTLRSNASENAAAKGGSIHGGAVMLDFRTKSSYFKMTSYAIVVMSFERYKTFQRYDSVDICES